MGAYYLSYPPGHEREAAALAQGLRDAGLSLWCSALSDERDGLELLRARTRALDECDTWLILVGDPADGDWVTSELDHAVSHVAMRESLRVLPMMLEGCPVGEHSKVLAWFDPVELPGRVIQAHPSIYAAIKRLLESRQAVPAIDPGSCPYPGMAAFPRHLARFMLGREGDIRRVCARYHEGRRWMHIVGPSGSGKSSLALAGVLPAAERGWFAPLKNQMLSGAMRPGPDPIGALAGLLSAVGAGDKASLRDQLEGDGGALRDLLREHLPPRTGYLLLVDELGELYAHRGRDPYTAHRFEQLLTTALDDEDGPLFLLTTMADDGAVTDGDLSRLAALVGIYGGAHRADPLGREALELVLDASARMAGLAWEPGLAERVLNDAMNLSDDRQPLLGNLLRALWTKRSGVFLTNVAYASLYGIRGALGRESDRLLGQLVDEDQERAKRLLLELGGAGGHGPQLLSYDEALELAGQDDRGAGVLSWLGATDGLQTSVGEGQFAVLSVGGGGDGWVELAHPVMAKAWHKLAGWLDDVSPVPARGPGEVPSVQIGAVETLSSLSLPRDPRRVETVSALSVPTGKPKKRDEPNTVRLGIEDTGRASSGAIETVHLPGDDQTRQVRVRLGMPSSTLDAPDRDHFDDEEEDVLDPASALEAGELTTDEDSHDEPSSELATLQPLTPLAGRDDVNRLTAVTFDEPESSEPPQVGYPEDEDDQDSVTPFIPGHVFTASRDREAGRATKSYELRQRGTRVAAMVGALALLLGLGAAGARYWRAEQELETARITAASTQPTPRAEPSDPLYERALEQAGSAVKLARTADFDGFYEVLGAMKSAASADKGVTPEVLDALMAVVTSDIHRVLRTGSAVLAVDFGPGGHRLATGGDGSLLRLWETRTGVRSAGHAGHQGAITDLAWGPTLEDGREMLVTGGLDRHVRVWDAATGKNVVLSQHTDRVRAVDVSSGGDMVASGSDDRTARIWSPDGNTLKVLTGHQDAVLAVAFSPDGRRVATGSADVSARIWDVRSGRMVSRLSGHRGAVTAADYSPDNRKLVTASEDGTARIWDTRGTSLLMTLRAGEGTVYDARFSSDGDEVITASEDGTATIWDAKTGRVNTVLRGHSGPVRAAALSTNDHFAVTASEDGTAHTWVLSLARSLPRLSSTRDVPTAATWSADGVLVALGSRNGDLRIWEAGTGRLLMDQSAHRGPIEAVSFSADGQTIASSSSDGVRIWNVRTEAEVRNITVHKGSVTDIGFSDDGERLVTTSQDGGARIWSADGARTQTVLQDHGDYVRAADWAGGSERVATGGDDRALKVWDANTGAVTASFTAEDWIRDVALARDGSLAAAGVEGGTVSIWNVATKALVKTFDAHDTATTSVDFSSDGERLLTAGSDGRVRVWNTDGSRAYDVIRTDDGGVTDARFSPDGGWIVATLETGEARILPGTPNTAMAVACAAVAGTRKGEAYAAECSDYQ